ncbi:hypothetical protein F503_04599 [Ophiostoma piceae UAMH 11346]|uniref:Uncharacterized protein n=1 Tax=Ophiostoma piceae (strain UAMH 11346) TaxID=1262450 RepID=S3C850_OPHP1|nr:hypothetical protein F503_04599 [Ophiostoma piceae UAMH 11346]
MAPTANRPAPSQPASRPKNARAPVVPVIPLPIAQKQQQARQLKQQKQEELEKEKKAAEAKKAQEQAELEQKKKLDEKRLKLKENVPLTPTSNNTTKTVIASPTLKSPSDIPSSPPAATDSTPRTAHGTATTVSSPDSKIPPSPHADAPAATVAAPAAPVAAVAASLPETTGRQTPATGPAVYSGTPSHNLHAPLLAGLPPNGNVPADFVFPVQSRSASAARHRGPSARHPANAPPHGFHQTHLSNNSITFGFQPSNNPSPAPVGHGPLPPPPGLLAGPPYVPFNAPNMGPGDWAGPPGVAPVGDVNGYTPTTAGFNSSNPGSFRGSHSPDHAVDGIAYGHQAGPFPLPGPNGTIPPRNDSMPAMSPHFFHPEYPGGGPLERHGGPGGAPGGSPVRVVDFQLIQHLQQQVHHSFDSPQTADTHILLHFPKDPSQASRNARSDPRNNEQSKMFAGHRAVLSQSYTIAQFLRNDPGTMHPGPYNQPVFSYHLKIDDPFLTSEAAMQALRSLYGLPIESLSAAGQPIGGAMDKALANLAAGFLFMLENVKAVGAEQVSQLISWETVERVFAFCLNGASFPNLPDNPSPNPYEQPFLRADFRYGDSTSPIIRRLLQAAIGFVVRNFPHDVQLSLGGVVDSALPRFSRFPAEVSTKAHKAAAQAHVSAQINSTSGIAVSTGADAAHSRSNGSVSMPFRSSAGGSTGQAGIKSPQLMFGDFAPREDSASSLPFPKANGVVADTACVVALSQILVSLPFGYLKHILEHPALGTATANAEAQGPITFERRRALIGSVTEERERHRQDALNSIRAGLVIDIAEQREAVLSRVQGPASPQHRDHPFAVDAWDSLGWKEYSYGDEPKLGRVWAQSETSR